MTRWERSDPLGASEVAVDSFRAMMAFLRMEERPRFTEDGRESLRDRCATLAAATGQMDAGQRGKGISFDELPFCFINIAVAACILVMSGKLDELEVEE